MRIFLTLVFFVSLFSSLSLGAAESSDWRTREFGFTYGGSIAGIGNWDTNNRFYPGVLVEGLAGAFLFKNLKVYGALTFFGAGFSALWLGPDVEWGVDRYSLRAGAGGGWFVPPNSIRNNSGNNGDGDRSGAGFKIVPSVEVIRIPRAGLALSVRGFYIPAWGSYVETGETADRKHFHQYFGIGIGINGYIPRD